MGERSIKGIFNVLNKHEEMNIINPYRFAGSTLPLGNIISAWQFNSSDSTDSVSTNDGTDTSISYTTGQVGNCADFTASTNSKIQIANTSELVFGNGTTDSPFSVSLWVNFNAVGTNQYFISDYYTNTTRVWRVGLLGGDMYFQLYDSSATNANIFARFPWTPSTATWYSITATYDGSSSSSGIYIYLNGALDGSHFQGVSGTYTAMEDLGQPIVLGKYQSSSVFSLNGYLDEVIVWDKALTSDEVLDLYTQQNAGTNILA